MESQDRLIARNVLLFVRSSRRTLQQKHLANRMHHRYVLMFALETSGVVSVDGQSIHLNAGNALLVLPYQFHHYIDLEEDAWRCFFITFE
ncbi:MAG: AraC family ligand binding domain-containing protein [Opitutales bacterium]